jgi:hypothetical protein
LIDLTDEDTRQRLSQGAGKAFFNIMDAWNIRDADARCLMGDMSNGSFYAFKKNPAKTLDSDKLRRISYLIGIFKALNILHGQELADEWMRLNNSNRIFAGQTPVEYLIRGGLPAFETLRRLLDARRGS